MLQARNLEFAICNLPLLKSDFCPKFQYIYVPMLYVVILTERVFLKQFHQISKKNER